MTPALPAERNGKRTSDLPSLTGLRIIAALLVFFAHASMLYNPLDLAAPINFYADQDVAEGMAHVFAPAGFVGVSFFFVLSGFVLTWSRRDGDRTGAFWRRRLLKIFPSHLVTWAVVMVLFAAPYTPAHAWLPNLFLVHSFIPQPETFSSVNVPAWSLCSELLFYLAFPFIIRPLLRIPERRLWPAAGAMVAGVATVAVLAKYVVPAGISYPLGPLPMTKMWFAYLFPPSRIFEFVLGVLLARIVMCGRWPRIGAVPVAAMALVGYAAAVEVPAPYNFALTTVVPIAAIICTAAASDIRGERTLLNRPFTVWLGTVSFGFYIIQAVPIFYGRLKIFGGRTYDSLTATALLFLLLAGTLLLGWMLCTIVELPVMRRWGRTRARTGTAVAGPAGIPAPRPGIGPGPAQQLRHPARQRRLRKRTTSKASTSK
ncbi:acyltransferase [Streptomyces sp. B8F3]|uniref:acyltransferase family protein n=1 Tax=unclassified Streptomyces TaxID=2593676 RepID=UPI00325E0DB1